MKTETNNECTDSLICPWCDHVPNDYLIINDGRPGAPFLVHCPRCCKDYLYLKTTLYFTRKVEI